MALGGDGGDEVLAGYDPFIAHRSVRMLGPLGRPAFGLLKLCSTLLPASERNMSAKFKARYFLQGVRSYARSDCELRNSLWMATFEPDVQDTLFSDPTAIGTAWANIFEETLSNRAFSTAKEPIDRVGGIPLTGVRRDPHQCSAADRHGRFAPGRSRLVGCPRRLGGSGGSFLGRRLAMRSWKRIGSWATASSSPR